MYSKVLADKPQVVVLNKIDLDPEGEIAGDIEKRLGLEKVYKISAVAGQGLGELNEALWSMAKGQKE